MVVAFSMAPWTSMMEISSRDAATVGALLAMNSSWISGLALASPRTGSVVVILILISCVCILVIFDHFDWGFPVVEEKVEKAVAVDRIDVVSDFRVGLRLVEQRRRF